MLLTNREIRLMASALSVLSQRTLPNVKSDLKVAALRRRYIDPANLIVDDAREAILRNNPTPDGAALVPKDIEERRNAEFYGVLSNSQELPKIPARLMLTPEDLPVKESDRVGVADIITALGPLFADPNPFDADDAE